MRALAAKVMARTTAIRIIKDGRISSSFAFEIL
jgi:hypothetical protein